MRKALVPLVVGHYGQDGAVRRMHDVGLVLRLDAKQAVVHADVQRFVRRVGGIGGKQGTGTIRQHGRQTVRRKQQRRIGLGTAGGQAQQHAQGGKQNGQAFKRRARVCFFDCIHIHLYV